MAEVEEPESASVSRPDQLRQCTVLVGENLLPDPEYPTGVYEFFADVDDCPETSTVSLIAVVEIDGKVVVAVPHSAWHRTVAKRKLPHNCLVKPVSIAVPFEDRTSTEDPPVFRTEKLWIGYLAVGHEEQVLFDSSAERADGDLLFVPDCPSLLPTAEGLAAAVEQHFSFASAQSGPELIAAAPPVSLESRLTSLEATLANVTKSLQQLGAPPQPSFAQPAATAAPCPPRPPGLPRQGSYGGGGLDAEVLASARMVGISDAHIQEMAQLANRGRPNLPDLPTTKRAAEKKDVLSETDEEAIDEEEGANAATGSGSDPITQALVKLTKITSHLAKQKKSSSQSWEAVLDGTGSAASGESQMSNTRRHAAALRLLKKSLKQNPKAIYQTIEQNLESDFQGICQLPGSAAVPVSARAWLELRSKVQPYPTPVRLLWGVAGVLDALRSNAPEEARARAALILCQGDQLSIDRGSWVVASEFALEDPPPMTQFSQHSLPSDTEPPYSKLIDPRWMELVLHRLNEFDQLAEKKKKFSKRPNPAGRDGEAPKGKGKGKKGGDRAPQADAEQT